MYSVDWDFHIRLSSSGISSLFMLHKYNSELTTILKIKHKYEAAKLLLGFAQGILILCTNKCIQCIEHM